MANNHEDTNLLPRTNESNVVCEEESPAGESAANSWQTPLTMFTSKKYDVAQDKALPRKIRTFYKNQNSLIDEFEKITEDNYGQNEEESESKKHKDQSTVDKYAKISFLMNAILMVAKTVAAILSGSLSVFSSVVDSAVDLLSGFIMWLSNRAVKKTNYYRYPTGRTKLEPIAIVVLSTVMSLASVFVIIESAQKIIEYASVEDRLPVVPHMNHTVNQTTPNCEKSDLPSTPNVDVVSICILVSTIVIKFSLWILMVRISLPSVKALALDHRNDALSNFMALLMGFIGTHFWSYADPVGAILIGVYIIFSWWQMGYDQIKMLTGHTADPDFLKRLTWLALNHDRHILKVETVRAFHFGNNYLVEMDIILPSAMTIQEAHDIQEPLQKRLENMPQVERAFVHIDYEYTHRPSEEHKVV